MKDMINKIILGDCMDIMKTMPDKCVDLVLTDPPYGISYSNKNLGRKAAKNTKSFEVLLNDNGELDYNFIMGELCRIGKIVVVFGAYNFYKSIPFKGRIICWDKRTCIEADRMLGSPFELAWINKSSGYDKIYRIMHGGVVNADSANTVRIHPTQKPVVLFSKIIQDYSKENDIIFDPFIGSGTTAIAAIRTGRQFIGIEKDPEYHRLACERVEKEQNNLFN